MFNKVILIGNAGNDPDIRTMPNGSKFASFSLATYEFWNDKDGNRQERTEWHKICVYNDNLVKIIEKYIYKGSKLFIEGQVRYRKYTNAEGKEIQITEIVLQGFNSSLKVLDKLQEEPKQEEQKNAVDDDIPF